MDERPIVFTISALKSSTFKIVTNDPRGKEANVSGIEKDDLFSVLYYITCRFNAKNYAVLFEVE